MPPRDTLEPPIVTALFVRENSVPARVRPVPAVYVVFVSVAAIVKVSVPAVVVSVTLEPAAIVSVSVALSATKLS